MVFTTAYTDFRRDCRPGIARLPPPDSLEARLGTPIPLVCRGPGGQAAFVSFDKRVASIFIGSADPADPRRKHLATQPRDFVNRPGRRLSWRLANGRPFAAMLRVTGDPETGTPDGFGVSGSRVPVSPQVLMVSAGLPGFEQAGTTMDIDKTNPESAFPARVDTLYLPPTPWPPRH